MVSAISGVPATAVVLTYCCCRPLESVDIAVAAVPTAVDVRLLLVFQTFLGP